MKQKIFNLKTFFFNEICQYDLNMILNNVSIFQQCFWFDLFVAFVNSLIFGQVQSILNNFN